MWLRCWRRASEDLPGRYLFLFQPGEEALCGAKAMVEGGALELMDGARLVGFHVTSQLPTGMVALRDGVAMSEAHSLRITLSGPGGHGAIPDRQGDVVRAAAELVRTPRRGGRGPDATRARTASAAPARWRAGTAVNVVPTEARITGTLRTFTAAQREEALRRLRDLCDEVADAMGVQVDLELPEHTPAVVNDPAVTVLVEAQALAALGPDNVLRMPPAAPSDDVSEFLNRLPGCYFFVGGASAGRDERAASQPVVRGRGRVRLRVGANVVVRSALALAAP